MGEAFSGVTGKSLFPAASGSRGSVVRYNFGDQPFAFGPPDETYASVCDRAAVDSATGGIYKCVHDRGVAIRAAPSQSATRSHGPAPGDTIEVTRVVQGIDGDGAALPYLQLACGRGYCATTLPGMESFFEQVSNPTAANTDWEACYASSWTIEMDAALIHYATERAAAKGKRSVEDLALGELLDEPPPSAAASAEATAGEEDEAQEAAESELLTRGVSVAPRFSQEDATIEAEAGVSPCDAPKTLRDNSNAAIRARFVLLQAYNQIIRPALPMIDLWQYDVDNTLGHLLCKCKGRLLPKTKNFLVDSGLRLTAGSDSVPEVHVHMPMPGSKEEEEGDSVFEQIFKKLPNKYQLLGSRREGSEAQLWKVRMDGPGANLLHTDTTDAGGWFRSSVRSLCTDLQASAKRNADGTITVPLFIKTPNSLFGGGIGGDAGMEKWLPNPLANTQDHLDRFRFIGGLMGSAARTSSFFEIDMPSLIWKYLLGEKIGTHEVADIDARVAQQLEAGSPALSEAEWDAQETVYWSVRLVNGRVLAVRGDGSAVQYPERTTWAAACLQTWENQFSDQLQAIRDGFYGTFPELSTRLLTWRELERRVSGQPDVSVQALKKIARYESGYRADDAYITQFWAVIESMSGLERKGFLGFCWGRGRLPPHPTQPLTIDCSGDSDNSMPHSHTCMFQLHLPRYSSPEILKQRLLTAIQNGGSRGVAGGVSSYVTDAKTEGLATPGQDVRTIMLEKCIDGGCVPCKPFLLRKNRFSQVSTKSHTVVTEQAQRTARRLLLPCWLGPASRPASCPQVARRQGGHGKADREDRRQAT
eukprot:COSAG02_NODE_1289_length_13445_cov_16.898322_8_plen_816_part_00